MSTACLTAATATGTVLPSCAIIAATLLLRMLAVARSFSAHFWRNVCNSCSRSASERGVKLSSLCVRKLWTCDGLGVEGCGCCCWRCDIRVGVVGTDGSRNSTTGDRLPSAERFERETDETIGDGCSVMVGIVAGGCIEIRRLACIEFVEAVVGGWLLIGLFMLMLMEMLGGTAAALSAVVAASDFGAVVVDALDAATVCGCRLVRPLYGVLVHWGGNSCNGKCCFIINLFVTHLRNILRNCSSPRLLSLPRLSLLLAGWLPSHRHTRSAVYDDSYPPRKYAGV